MCASQIPDVEAGVPETLYIISPTFSGKFLLPTFPFWIRFVFGDGAKLPAEFDIAPQVVTMVTVRLSHRFKLIP